MRKLPTVPTPRGPRFVRHTGTALFLRRLPRAAPAGAASILIIGEPIDAGTGVDPADVLVEAGIRVIVATGLSERFLAAAVRQGILAVSLPPDLVETMGRQVDAEPHQTVVVDLEHQTIDFGTAGRVSFDVPARVRRRLLHALDDFDELIEHREVAVAFLAGDARRRPWLY